MTTEAIFTKFAEALFAIGKEDGQLQGQAVVLALRLAIADAYTAGADSVLMQALDKVQPAPDRRQQESLQAQITELNEWLANHAPTHYWTPTDTAQAVLAVLRDRLDEIAELQGQVLALDADNAGLTQRLREAQAEIDRLTRLNTIATDTLNSTLEQHRNGTGATAEAPQWWSALDDETNDYRISLEHGRRKFREVPKQARLLLAQAFARSIGSGALPKQSEFDAHKPDWMPGGGGLVTTFGCNWSELLTVKP